VSGDAGAAAYPRFGGEHNIVLGGQLIIRDDDAQRDISTVTLVSEDGATELSLELTNAFVPEFREHLVSRGFRIPEGEARSVVTEVIVATAGNPAAWTAVGATIVAFLHRHRGKVHRFEVEGKTVSVEGYSARQAERLAADILGLSRARGGRRNQVGTAPEGQR
jgi:hypothetical protein